MTYSGCLFDHHSVSSLSIVVPAFFFSMLDNGGAKYYDRLLFIIFAYRVYMSPDLEEGREPFSCNGQHL